MGKSIGIDLGTTNTVMAEMAGDKPDLLIASDQERFIPSLVSRRDNLARPGERAAEPRGLTARETPSPSSANQIQDR